MANFLRRAATSLRRIMGRPAPQPVRPPLERRRHPDQDGSATIRRWESAKTDRLNQAHWQGVGALDLNTINADLWFDLPMLRARCTYEAYNNPFVEGVIETHMTDIVGPDGPILDVQSDDNDYNDALEDAWAEWFSRPDINGVLSGVEMLRLDIRSLWINGEYLDQIVTDPGAIGPVQMRLLSIHPARLMTPPIQSGEPLLIMGVLRTRQGKPLRYYIAEPSIYGPFSYAYDKFDPVPPSDVIHQFKVVESGQCRGVPWLASALQPIADLRDFDTQVLDAARAAADQSSWLYTDHPDAPFFMVNESVGVERRVTRTAPPGWKPYQMASNQPQQNYVEYRKERHRDLGRPVNMPLMTVRLGSEDHNYASARFDNQVYERGNSVIQSWVGRNKLNRCVMEVAREAELARAIPPRPKNFGERHLNFIWPKPPHVDPEKNTAGAQNELEIGSADLSEIVARNGGDLKSLIKRRKRTAYLLRKAGLPPTPYWTPKNAAAPGDDQKPDEQKPDEQSQDDADSDKADSDKELANA